MDNREHPAWLRTRLSAERTLMAWNRTALTLIGFGFTIYKFFQEFLQTTVGATATRPDAPRNLGLSMVLLGSLGTLIALWQYCASLRYLRSDQFKDIRADERRPVWPVALFLTILLAMVGIVATVVIAARL